MHDVRLGRSDLRVSAVAFGTWSFGGEWGAVVLGADAAALWVRDPSSLRPRTGALAPARRMVPA